MANVTLSIGGRQHVVACRDGEEARLTRLGQLLDSRSGPASRASGGNPERMMLLVALMLADQLDEIQGQSVDAQGTAVLARLADRLEAMASALEDEAVSA